MFCRDVPSLERLPPRRKEWLESMRDLWNTIGISKFCEVGKAAVKALAAAAKCAATVGNTPVGFATW